jgi:hypothetical protein
MPQYIKNLHKSTGLNIQRGQRLKNTAAFLE